MVKTENLLMKYLAFAKTAETGSFTAAAAELNYAQSSVSKMIADLEQHFGAALLERGKGGVTVTSFGMEILPRVRRILGDCDELEQYADSLRGLESGFVRIGTFASAAINLLPDIFGKFQKDYPKIECEMLLGDYTDVRNWIDEGRVDCGFLPLPIKDFDFFPVERDEYVVVMPTGHPLAEQSAVDIKQLENEPFLLLEHGGKTEVSEILEKWGVKPKIRFTTWEDFAVMAMAEKGLGVGILPSMILKRIPYNLEIRPLKERYFRDIGIAVKNVERLSPAAKRFLSYLRPKNS